MDRIGERASSGTACQEKCKDDRLTTVFLSTHAAGPTTKHLARGSFK